LHRLATTPELQLLRQSAREALRSLYRGWPDDAWPDSWAQSWDMLAGLGLWSVLEPPDGSLAAAAVITEELGRALYPGPGPEALAASYVVNRVDDAEKLSTIAGGGPAAVLASGGVVLDPMVQVKSETLLVVALPDGLGVLAAADGDVSVGPSLDVSRRIVQIRLRTQPVPVASCADTDLACYGRAARQLLYCADTLGCVEHVLERTTEYAKQRTAFGSPIGKYQAVAHRLVDHAVNARQMRLSLYAAVAAFDDGAHDLQLRAATAETFFWGRGTDIISDCIQLCGAIGFTWEFGHHFYLRRATQNASLGGGAARPHARLAKESAW
jgi:alkylation response protein AidB-like acyl-CoA dehydrogenase